MDEITIARVNALKAVSRARDVVNSAERAYNALLNVCPGNCPADFKGHWRDWHRGHGCDADVRGNILAYEREIAAQGKEG